MKRFNNISVLESHGTSLYGLDDLITKLYNDIKLSIKTYKYVNNYQQHVLKEFVINDTKIKFITDIYSISFNLFDYFKDYKNENYEIIINIHDIVDKKFSESYDNYKDILLFYDGYTDMQNKKVVLNLNSYKCKIDPSPFFIICTHELQHFYTKQKHKNDANLVYFNAISEQIQNYILYDNYLSEDDKSCLTFLFYLLFSHNEISSYASQLYGELAADAKKRKAQLRSFKEILNNTDSYTLSQSFDYYISYFKEMSNDKIFEICKFIYNYNKNEDVNNKFQMTINKFIENNNKVGFKRYLLKIFLKNAQTFNLIINKIASNYSLCESMYENSEYCLPKKCGKSLIWKMKKL